MGTPLSVCLKPAPFATVKPRRYVRQCRLRECVGCVCVLEFVCVCECVCVREREKESE